MNPQPEQRGGVSVRFLSILGFFLLCIVLSGYIFYGLQPVLRSRTPEERDIVNTTKAAFKVVKNESFRDIAAHLSRESLISSLAIFKLYAIVSGNAHRFQPGVYELTPSMSVPQIVRELIAAGKNEVTVTIVEGYSVKDIDSVLAKAGVIERETLSMLPLGDLVSEFPFIARARSLEGFLFPDTYRFEINAGPKAVAKTLLTAFRAKAMPILGERSDWYERLILASFLEREIPLFEDRQLVAGIVLRRLALGMPLQIDATLSYAKCDGYFKLCPTVRVARADMSMTSPYNTYQRLGFTPTPIANPGEAALRAAVTPRSSAYLYYLSAAKTGETLFSKTLPEHNAKRAKYL